MKPYELFREEEWTIDGRMIEAGTHLPEEPLQLLVSDGDQGMLIVGMVTNIRRIDNRVWGDVHMESELDYPEAVTIDIQGGEIETNRDGKMTVSGGKLTAATCNYKSNYPWKDAEDDQ